MLQEHTLYRQLADTLRRRIVDGAFVPGAFFATEHGLVRDLRISRVTVRRSSNLLIRDGLLERRPGRGLFVRGAGAPVGDIRVVCRDLVDEARLAIIRAIRAAASRQGYDLLIHDADGRHDAEGAAIRRLCDGACRGAIICGPLADASLPILRELRSRGFPFVLVGGPGDQDASPWIGADDRQGGRLAGETLLAHGHRRIAFVGDLGSIPVRDRLDGLQQAIGSAGRQAPQLVVRATCAPDLSPAWLEQIASNVRCLLASPTAPTAFVAGSGATVTAIASIAATLGLAIPDDLGLIGFDDDASVHHLTTIGIPAGRIGTAAFEMLMRRIAGPDADPERRSLPVRLIDRGSLSSAGATGSRPSFSEA